MLPKLGDLKAERGDGRYSSLRLSDEFQRPPEIISDQLRQLIETSEAGRALRRPSRAPRKIEPAVSVREDVRRRKLPVPIAAFPMIRFEQRYEFAKVFSLQRLGTERKALVRPKVIDPDRFPQDRRRREPACRKRRRLT